MKEVRESLDGSIDTQKNNVTKDFTDMWNEMDDLFKELR